MNLPRSKLNMSNILNFRQCLLQLTTALLGCQNTMQKDEWLTFFGDGGIISYRGN